MLIAGNLESMGTQYNKSPEVSNDSIATIFKSAFKGFMFLYV